jgi:hypothetical protein
MELHELKNTWTVLEEQLKKNEAVNKKLILEMSNKKSTKSLNRLINIDLLSVIVLLLAIPTSAWLYSVTDTRYNNALSVKILAVELFVFCFIGLFWYYFKLKHLMKIDFSKNVKNNMLCINSYCIMLKREKIATYFYLFPATFLLAAFCYYELNATATLWIFLVAAVAMGMILSYWMYKRIYDTNIQSIKESLEELNELKEEE